MKVGYYYTNNKENIKKLINENITIIVDNEKLLQDLREFNVKKIIYKYDTSKYDVVIYDTDKAPYIRGINKYIIGNYAPKISKIKYLKQMDLENILKTPIIEENKKFSIIMPNYNNAEWIHKGIESVLNQTYTNWEMYIIDDMSTDNSIEEINKYKDKRITLIENEIKLYNGGSRNVGILKAKKNNPNGYLLFLDSDDWLVNNEVLKKLNDFIDDEDLITLNYKHYIDNKEQVGGINSYRNKNELFKTEGCMCAVWCKCFKVSKAPLFEFNTLMEDRIYHYRLINAIETFRDFGDYTHVWNKMNKKSVTSDSTIKYESDFQLPIEWNNCCYRHIAGMKDLLNELENEEWKNFIKDKIENCLNFASNGIYQQL